MANNNNNQSLEQPVSNFVNQRTTSVMEPMTLHYQPNRQASSTTNKIFGVTIFILIIILLAYIFFHGQITDTKLSRLTNSVSNSNDLKEVFQDMNRSLKSIELILMTQKKTNIDIILNGKDLHQFVSNPTVLNEFLRKTKEQL
ncbi:unnamed protein product [Adineta steineri]|uniref:Uncharacterized protein n=1 Tax=Adineta steineri TaxID=433720 RepID=A0A819AYE4_9BILA|nr:unnamed protein product [Adineta steineri]CAF1134248.1 unnamed protein product [Adineta steineri]CAF3791631.1 unnamed protein product [Adineta steineri]CAF3939067.1 unnamed protein product [Adineta steineri]